MTSGIEVPGRVLVLSDADVETGSRDWTVVLIGDGRLSALVESALTSSDAQFLAFAAPDTEPAEIDGLVRALQREPSVAALGAGTGGLIDVLAVPAGTVLLRVNAVTATAGPAALFDGAEALGRLDLGWRLRAAGWRVCTVGPAASELSGAPLVPDYDHDPAAAALRLAVLHRNLADPLLHELLPPALAATRRLEVGAEADTQYQALLSTLDRSGALAGRRRPDVEVLPYLRAEPGALPPGTTELAGPEGRRLLSGRYRVTIFCPDVVGSKMAGPAIRAWELSHALAAEHEVVLVASLTGDRTSEAIRLVDLQDPSMRAAVSASEVVLVQGWVLFDYPWIADLDTVVIADLYDPTHLENLEQQRDRSRADRDAGMAQATHIIMGQIRRGDFFLCASPRQRDLWLGHLAAAGRLGPATYDGDESLRRLVAEVPFGVSTAPIGQEPGAIKGVIPGIGPDDEVVLWGGGIWNWFDPLTLIRAVARVHESRPQLRLVFLGTRHPNPGVPEMAMTGAAMALSDELGLTDRVVFFNQGWVPYEERGRWFADADLGVSCHYDHLETAFAFRTRMLDYLWAGLPIVATGGDHFGDLIAARRLGEVVPTEDLEALATAIGGLLADPDRMEACRAAVRATAAEMTWEQVAEPLLEFCRRPTRAGDAVSAPAAAVVTVVPPPPRSRARRIAHRLSERVASS